MMLLLLWLWLVPDDAITTAFGVSRVVERQDARLRVVAPLSDEFGRHASAHSTTVVIESIDQRFDLPQSH